MKGGMKEADFSAPMFIAEASRARIDSVESDAREFADEGM